MFKFVVSLVVLSATAFALQELQCPRSCPEEIWYSDYSHLLKTTTMEEMAYYFRLIFGRLEDGNLFTFIPYIEEDPEQARNLTRRMVTVEKTALALMAKSYDVMEESWLALGETGRMFTAGTKPASEVIRLMEDLQKAHVRGNELLIEAGREVSLFFKDMIEFVVEGVTRILETELDTPPEGHYELAKLINDKIIKISHTDLVGVIVRRFIGRSTGTVQTSPSTEPPNVLFAVLPRIDQMMADFKKMIDQEPLSPESWARFWEETFQKSLDITKKRHAAGQENFQLIYRNEVYVAEVLMNMITSYS